MKHDKNGVVEHDKRTRIVWTPEEKATVVERAVTLLKSDHRLSNTQLLKRSQTVLPEGRRRNFTTVPWDKLTWFTEGVEAGLSTRPEPAPVPAPPERVPEPPPSDPPIAALLEHASNDDIVAVLLSRVVRDREADADMIADLLDEVSQLKETLDRVARSSSRFEGLLRKLVGELDPAAIEPEPPVAVEPPPAATPQAKTVPRLKVAVVGILPRQADEIKASIGPSIDVRTFMDSSKATSIGFGNYDAVVITRHARHFAYNAARSALGSNRVHRLRATSVDAVVDAIRTFARDLTDVPGRAFARS